MDILAVLMFVAWGICLANIVAFLVAWWFCKNYSVFCENIRCQILPKYMLAVFSIFFSLSIAQIIVLDILMNGWSDSLFLMIFILAIAAYFGISSWKKCNALENAEEIPEETCGCGQNCEEDKKEKE